MASGNYIRKVCVIDITALRNIIKLFEIYLGGREAQA